MTALLDERDLERAMAVMAVLAKYDPVEQQKALEICVLKHAARMGNMRDAVFVVDSFYKHVIQLLKQHTY